MSWVWSLPVIVSVLGLGACAVSVADAACVRLIAGRGAAVGSAPSPGRWLRLWQTQPVTPERPDRINLVVAPALYLVLAVIALALVPFGPRQVMLDTPAGIVVWGATESLTVVAVFLHGWSQNSLFPLIGGYRFAALGLCAMLVSMFVLIGVALPAESLAIGPIVEAQRDLWNVVRQPLGLPLFVLLGLAISLRGPMDFADSADLADGTSAEDAGAWRAAWQLARSTMLVAFSAMAATAFLGGYLGPALPGALWLTLKTLVVLVAVVALGHLLARPDASRALSMLWTVLLPLAFLDLVIAGIGSLK